MSGRSEVVLAHQLEERLLPKLARAASELHEAVSVAGELARRRAEIGQAAGDVAIPAVAESPPPTDAQYHFQPIA
jgi:hypothetical protein